MARSERSLTALDALRGATEQEQRERGYFHTLREILQQPETWPETEQIVRRSDIRLDASAGPLVLTGSGSSHFIGESLEPLLASALRRPVRAVPAGSILTHGESYFFPGSPGPPGTLVSFARSGNSPESCGAVDWLLERAPDWRHVVVTCNREGALATGYRNRDNVSSVILDERTNDRSLVMTSSFTNLWLAGMILAGGRPDVAALSRGARAVFEQFGEELGRTGSAPFERAVFLGSGPRFGAAREGALKMLEMTDGRIPTFAESFLGLRHGPMCALRDDTLLVAFLARAERESAYERDLLAELADKNVRPRRVLVGAGGDVPFDVDVGDEDSALLDVVVAQLLGLFRALSLGVRPDEPSAAGVISRVVRSFEIH